MLAESEAGEHSGLPRPAWRRATWAYTLGLEENLLERDAGAGGESVSISTSTKTNVQEL